MNRNEEEYCFGKIAPDPLLKWRKREVFRLCTCIVCSQCIEIMKLRCLFQSGTSKTIFKLVEVYTATFQKSRKKQPKKHNSSRILRSFHRDMKSTAFISRSLEPNEIRDDLCTSNTLPDLSRDCGNIFLAGTCQASFDCLSTELPC